MWTIIKIMYCAQCQSLTDTVVVTAGKLPHASLMSIFSAEGMLGKKMSGLV